MDLTFTLNRPAGAQDVAVSLDPTLSVGVLARRLLQVDPDARPDLLDVADSGGTAPLTLAVGTPTGWAEVDAGVPVGAAPLRSGSAIAVVPVGEVPDGAGDDRVVAVLTVLDGPDRGADFPLRAGAWTIGRGAVVDVRLNDPFVSKRHARLWLSAQVRVTDENSANGTQVDGVTRDGALLTPETRVTIGNSVIGVRRLDVAADADGVAADIGTPIVEFTRPPQVHREFVPLVESVPDPPDRPRGQALPVFSVLLPVLLAVVIWQVTRSGLAAAFLALTSLLLIGSVLEQMLFRRRGHRRATAAYRRELAALRERFTAATAREQEARRAEQPAVVAVRSAIVERTELLWSRRPDLRSTRFAELRLGTATRPARSRLQACAQRGDPVLVGEANAVASAFDAVRDVPVPVALGDVGSIGVCGPDHERARVARALVLQLVGLHAPGDLAVAAVLAGPAVPDWAWLRWLPHSAADLLGGAALGAGTEDCVLVVAALEELMMQRSRRASAWDAGAARQLPLVLLVVVEPVPVEPARLVALAEGGPAVGIHLLWCGRQVRELPAACRAYLDVGARGRGVVGLADTGEVIDVATEGLDAGTAETLARLLSPVVDAGAARDRQADLPRSASFVDVVGRDLVDVPAAIADRWSRTGTSPGARRPATLRALVGQGAGQLVHLDLREHGPHALVGGTTGAGKSEFLQSWILGLALDHGPQRVTFLLVDYKGGSAFAEAVRLPHTVGLVTDLTPRLVRRALTSLRAEIRHRERVLAAAGAPDLLELERRGDPTAPPALVIVVDEFAALVQEVPEFVDGVIDIAQRGRSLGVHLILATQRPAGVIRDNLRANTNLRVALRMADEGDSVDVLGIRDAAFFDPGVPGRAMAKTGPGRVTAFQALYAGGHTGSRPPAPDIAVRTLGFGLPTPWAGPEHEQAPPADARTDVSRIVDAARAAADAGRVAAPRRPWLPELPPVLDLTELTAGAGREKVSGRTGLVFGLADDPDRQRQVAVDYQPDRDGVLLVLGTGGAGKSAALRALAIAAAEPGSGGPFQVYGLDFGSRALAGLEELPHVGSVVAGDDHERVVRLLDGLRATVEERAVRYAGVDAATVEEYRTRAGEPDEPRILLLLDNFGGFRSAYEVGRSSRLYDQLTSLALDGRSVGVHLVVSADRPGVVPPALAAAVTRRLVLKLAAEMDLATAGLGADAFAGAPPGRGWLDGLEVQVGVIGADPDAAGQADRTRTFAARMRAGGAVAAPPVGRLADRVPLSSLRPRVDGLPTLGVAEDTLAEFSFATAGTFLIAGPPQSGRTTALLAAVRSLQRCEPLRRLVYVGSAASPLAGSSAPDWAASAFGADAAPDLAGEWTAIATQPGVPPLALVIENLPAFTGTPAQEPLERVIATFAAAGHLVVADGESSALTSSWGLPQAMKAGRHGLLLQPDQQDGDSILRTGLPRVLRSQFPPGRGMYVRSGRARTVQVALPA